MAFVWPARVAHRCGGELAPENSLEGVLACARGGGRAIECDVRLSRDGTPWIFHDASLRRLCGLDQTVAATPDEVLARVRCGGGQAGFPQGVAIPRLEALLALSHRLGLALNLELKCDIEADAAPLAEQVHAVCVQARHLPDLLISSFSLTALGRMAVLAPEWPRALLSETWSEVLVAHLAGLDCVALNLAASSFSPDRLHALRARGRQLQLWTVNDPAFARSALHSGVQAVISDRAAIFLDASDPGNPAPISACLP